MSEEKPKAEQVDEATEAEKAALDEEKKKELLAKYGYERATSKDTPPDKGGPGTKRRTCC